MRSNSVMGNWGGRSESVGERTPLAWSFRRLAENFVPLTFSFGEESWSYVGTTQ